MRAPFGCNLTLKFVQVILNSGEVQHGPNTSNVRPSLCSPHLSSSRRPSFSQLVQDTTAPLPYNDGTMFCFGGFSLIGLRVPDILQICLAPNPPTL